MKAKTRILAMLLTVLMVVGLLPLTLFAASEDPSSPTSVSANDDSWDSIKQKLTAGGLDPYIYQNFEGMADSKFNDGVYDIPASHRGEWTDGTVTGEPWLESDITYCKRVGNPFEIKNLKDAFSIVQEADGNKAIYLGNATLSDANNDDNWFDIEGDSIGAGNDIFVSVDFKMGGDLVQQAQDGNTLLTFITRTANSVDIGRTDAKLIGLHCDGGIFLWDNDQRTEVVGYLSKTEYTRIAVETDLRNNKYYVYINDVLVNPEGCRFISDEVLNKIRVTKGVADFQYTDFLLAEARVYTVEGNTVYKNHHGMYMDNILLAGRTILAASNSQSGNVYTMDLSGIADEFIGTPVSDYNNAANKVPGTSDYGNYLYICSVNSSSKNAVVFYKEADGTVSIQLKKAGAQGDGGQTYPRITPVNAKTKAFVGQNMIFGGYYRAGSEKVKAANIIAPITRVNGKCEIFQVKYDADRNLKFWNRKETITLGKIPTDRFMKIEIHLICNAEGTRAMAKLYIDDELMYSTFIDGTNWAGKTIDGQVLTQKTPHVEDIHFTQDYGDHYNYVSDDMHFKGLTVSNTNIYNTATPEGRFNPFVLNETGFVKTAGITRYVENGVAKTADFVLGGETYKVGQSGAILGKLSDGVVHSSYAPYVDWSHNDEAAYIVNEPDGSNFHNKASFMQPGGDRAAFVKDGMYTKYGPATLYSSFTYYTEEELALPKKPDRNSYYDFGLGNRTNNSEIVLDFDIMLGQRLGEISLLTLITLTDPHGGNTAGNANRGDAWLLRIRDGWLVYNTSKVYKLSPNEFTRISFALKTPDAVEDIKYLSEGAPVYTETGRNEVTYSLEDFEALEVKPVAQEKTPIYGEAVA